MTESINFKRAKQILEMAIEQDCLVINDEACSDIKLVLQGNHKTYRYILMTGLLAKATNANVNVLALQAGANLEGAYDARSLCHKVIVPFEREYLSGSIGNSNEPFLNKPARFTQLSVDNAVRAGKDLILLKTVIKIFNSLNNSQDAFNYLIYSVCLLKENIRNNESAHISKIAHNPTLKECFDFIENFVGRSFEGETCAIIVGSLEKLYYKYNVGEFNVLAHKVNQSGASSKEIGDIDIYKGDEFRFAIEVKDKDFTEYDLEHAFNKMITAGSNRGQFIYGPKANFNAAVNKKIKSFEAGGFFVLFLNIFSYSKMMLLRIDFEDKQEFIDVVYQVAKEINCKKATLDWINATLTTMGWR